MNYLRCVCGLEMSARCATWTADADVRKRRAISSPAGAGAMPIPLVWRHAAVSVAAVSMSRTRCFSRAVSTGRQTARQRNTAISTRISGRHVTVAELVMPAHAARSFVAMAIARAMGTTEPPSEGTTETVSAAACLRQGLAVAALCCSIHICACGLGACSCRGCSVTSGCAVPRKKCIKCSEELQPVGSD